MADVTTTFAAKDESFAKTVDKLQGRLTGFSGNVESFNSKVAGIASSFAKFAGPIAGVATAFFGAKAAVESFGNALAMGGRLDDLSKRTGASAGEMLLLEKAFDLAGSSAEAVGPTISKLNRFLAEASVAGSSQDEALRGLGLTYARLSELSPTEQMNLLAERIAAIKNPAMQTQAAMAVFGKTGGELIPLLSDFSGELAKARGFLGGLPGIMDENAAAFADLDDNIREIREKFDQFVAGLITGLVPALTSVTNKLANLDAAGLGKAFSGFITSALQAVSNSYLLGDAIDNVKTAIEAIVSGDTSKGLQLMFVTMKVTALNAVNEIVSNFRAGLKTVGQFLGSMFGPESGFFKLAASTIDFIAFKFESRMADALASMLAGLPFVRQSVIDNLEKISQAADQQATAMTHHMSIAAKQIGKDFIEAGKAFPESFAANKSQLQPLFDLTEVLAEQKRLQAEITAKIAEAAAPAAEIAESAKVVSLALGDIPATLQSSVDLSGQIFTNLSNASIVANGVEPAFSLAADSTGKMALDLETTKVSAGEAGEFIEQANHATGQMSLNGSNFAASAALAASKINEAKVDATIAAETFTGMSDRMQQGAGAVNESLDKMREAHHFGRLTAEEVKEKLKAGGMGLIDAQKAASDYMAAQSKMTSDMQTAEQQKRTAEERFATAEERAQRMEQNNQDGAAHKIRMQAQEAFTKSMEKIAPDLEKGVETAKKMLEESGKKTGNTLKDGAKEAGKVLTDAGKEVAKALKDVISPEGKDQGKNFAEEIYKFFKDTFFIEFKTRLPQNALS